MLTRLPGSNPIWLLIWLLVMLTASTWLGWRWQQGIQFDTSIMALLPAGESDAAIDFANQSISANASQRLLLLLSGQRTSSLEQAQRVQQSLVDSGLFADVSGGVDPVNGLLALSQLRQWRYFHLSDQDRHQLQEPLLGSALVPQAVGRLLSPAGAQLAEHLIDDPLQLHDRWQSQVLGTGAVSLQDDWPTHIERQSERSIWHRIIVAQLNDSAFAIGYQQQVMALLQRLDKEVEGLSYSGLIVHASHGAQQARAEISTIGLFSLLGVIVLMMLAFRRAYYLLLVFLPLLCGCLLALAVCLWIFPSLHIITLAFGASLVGVAIDYSLHFLCHRVQQVSARTKQHKQQGIALALTLGMMSSVLAYMAQAATPFPGLQQMAIFSAAGLLGAWLTVLAVLPALTRRIQPQPQLTPLLHMISSARHHWPRVEQPRVAVVLLMLTLVCGWQVSRLSFDDHIARLQTSPQHLIQQDQRINELLDGASWVHYLLVSANSEQQLLQRNEALRQDLQPLLQEHTALRIHSVSQQLSSLQRQQYNYQLLAQQVYAPGGLVDPFFTQLGNPSLAQQARQDFLQQQDHYLTPDQWLSSEFSQAQQALWLGEFDGRYYSIVNFSGRLTASLNQQLETIAQHHKGVQWVDRPQNISQLLGNYRHQATTWLMLAYGLVLAMLLVKYRGLAWRALAGPLLASMLTLSVLSTLGMHLTLFNILALLLVLGIGLDAGIFMLHNSGSSYTWLAVALSAITTLLAFGLLALSATPVLMYFGSTVLCGVVLVWIFTPIFTLGCANDKTE